MKNLVKKFVLSEVKQPLAIVGEAGMGKTAIVEEIASELNLPLVKLLTSSMDETDVNGIIIRTDDGAKYVSPAWSRKLAKDGILFLDEFNCGRKEVVDSLLTLVCNKQFPNGDKLGSNVIIIAAMNDAVRYNNYELSPAMKNRFAWLTWKMDKEDWLKFVANKCPNAADLYRRAGVEFEKEFNSDEEKFTTPRSLYNLALFAKDNVESLLTYAPMFINNVDVKRLNAVKFDDNKQEDLNKDVFGNGGGKSNIYKKLSKYGRGGSNGQIGE